MVQVRGYPDQQVRQQGLPRARLNVRATPDAFGAPIAESVDRAVNVVARVHLEEKAKADRDEVVNAQNKFNAQRSVSYHSKEQGLYGKKLGKDAYQAADEAYRNLDEFSGTIADSLNNEEQKTAFNQWATEQKIRIKDESDGWAMQQGDQYRNEVTESSITIQQQQAVDYASSPTDVARIVSEQQQTIAGYALATGMSPEKRQLMEQDASTNTHAAVIQTLLNGEDDQGAKAHYEQFKDQMHGQVAADVAAQVEHGSFIGEAQRGADAIIAANPKANSVELSEAVAKQFGDNPKMRDAVDARVSRLKALRDDATEENNRNAYNQALTIVTDPANHKGMDAVPIAMQTALREADPERYARLESMSIRESKAIPTVTEWTTYNALRLAAAEQPQAFVKENMPDYFDRLAPAERKELIDLQASLITKRDSPETQAKIAEIRDFDSVVRGTLGPAGINPALDYSDPNRAAKENNARVEAFSSALRRRVTGRQATTGKQLTREEVQREADALMLEDVYKVDSAMNYLPGFFDHNVKVNATRHAFENPVIAGQAYSLDQVPAEFHDQLAQALNAEGFKYDADPAAYEFEMIRRYNLHLARTNAQ